MSKTDELYTDYKKRFKEEWGVESPSEIYEAAARVERLETCKIKDSHKRV